MRLPNGYGSISKLPGNRRNKFLVRKTVGTELDHEKGKVNYKQLIIGYAPTKKAALEMLNEYNQNPYDVSAAKTTFEELYRKAAKEINDKLNMYRERRPEGAMLDHLRMVAFDFAFKVVNSEYRNDTQPYKDKLEQLTKEMEELFQKEEQKEGI